MPARRRRPLSGSIVVGADDREAARLNLLGQPRQASRGAPGGWKPSSRTTPVLSVTRARLSTRLLEMRPWVRTSLSRLMFAAAGRRNERPLNSSA